MWKQNPFIDPIICLQLSLLCLEVCVAQITANCTFLTRSYSGMSTWYNWGVTLTGKFIVASRYEKSPDMDLCWFRSLIYFGVKKKKEGEKK